MAEQNQITSCKHCKSELTGSFCSNCGQPKIVKRIDRKYIISEIGSVLNLDKGILFTIKELLIRPGKNVRDFIDTDRNRLVKPIFFLIICSLIYTIAQQLLHFEDEYVNASGFGESTITEIFEWIQKNYGYANILMALFIAAWVKVLFRKYNYNFFEILILLCFLMSIGMLIYTVFGVVESLTNLSVLNFGGLVGFTYLSWAIGRFFDKTKKMNYLKGLISYVLGMLSFTISALVFGAVIDLIKNI
ncbi:MAG: DUF3667 domain-containing protein [Flavobacteriales bacterium]|nr:DUF3667 domain-containing protein [Flavobacteriales bacterium]